MSCCCSPSVDELGLSFDCSSFIRFDIDRAFKPKLFSASLLRFQSPELSFAKRRSHSLSADVKHVTMPKHVPIFSRQSLNWWHDALMSSGESFNPSCVALSLQ